MKVVFTAPPVILLKEYPYDYLQRKYQIKGRRFSYYAMHHIVGCVYRKVAHFVAEFHLCYSLSKWVNKKSYGCKLNMNVKLHVSDETLTAA